MYHLWRPQPGSGGRSKIVILNMADFEWKSAIDVHAGLQPVAGWPFDAGSRSSPPAIPLSQSPGNAAGRAPSKVGH